MRRLFGKWQPISSVPLEVLLIRTLWLSWDSHLGIAFSSDKAPGIRRRASCCERDYRCNCPRNNCTDQAPVCPASDANVHQAFEEQADGEFTESDSHYHQDLRNVYILFRVSKQHTARLIRSTDLTYLFEKIQIMG